MSRMSQHAKDIGGKILPTRYRYLLLLATAFGGGYLLLSHSEVPELLILPRDPPGYQRRRHFGGDHETFTIHTEGCTIPGLQVFDPIFKHYIDPPQLIKPCQNPKTTPNTHFSKDPLLRNNETHIWINTDSIKHFKKLLPSPDELNLTCCYSAFHRPPFIIDIDSPNVDDRVEYYPCEYFSNSIEVRNEFVKVSCYANLKTIHLQYFLFARKKLFLYHGTDEKNDSSLGSFGYNVVILGIDSVSRLNFHRTMPKTLAFLRKKGAVELLGYNKVHDNTFPNLVPMLLGIGVDELKKTCWPYETARFDSCPFIWESFKSVGYYTAFVEDSAHLGTFNFERPGFAGTPTDYYTHPFMIEAENNVGNNKDFNSFICMGNKHFYKVLLEYVESLTSIIQPDKLFGFFWEITMTHDYLNYPMIMDDSYEKLLMRLDDTKFLNKTILILMSDHGIRWGRFRLTKQGRLEERLPLMQILLPQSFREKYGSAFENLKANRHRLVTPFDMHATLSDLIDLEDINNTNILLRSRDAYGNNRSISLFLPIPHNRTCTSADIKDHWCTCHSGEKLSPDSEHAMKAATHLINHLNAQLAGYEECALLSLAEVLEVTEMWVGKPDEDEVGWREFMVVARATPGDGVFEATLRRAAAGWSLAGSASRLNLYGDQSRCIHNNQLKLYCFCK